MPTTPRIGSLFTGTGALDMAVQRVFGTEVAWHSQYEPPDKNGREDPHQYAAKILECHFPGVPNLGDITKIDWQKVLDTHGPVDILTGGFPCQDVSSAGKQAGLVEGTRSGLWLQMAHAIAVLRPRLVVIENVEGLLSTKAASDVEPCAHCVGDPDREPPLRALGAVLGDLASLGFDAEWARVAASEVGAPHPRKRVFVLAWPADAQGSGLEGAGEGRSARRGAAASDAADVGHERGGLARGRRPGSANGDQVVADADGRGREGHPERDRGQDEGQPARERGLDAIRPGVRREAPADAERLGREGQRGNAGTHQERQAATSVGRRLAGAGEAASHAASLGHGHAGTPGLGGLPAAPVAGGVAAEPRCPTCGCPEYVHDAGGLCADCTACIDPELGCPDEAASDALGVGRGEGRTEPARKQGRPDAALRGGATSADADYERAGEEHQGADSLVGERSQDGRGPVELTWADRGGEPGDWRAAEEPAIGRGTAASKPDAGAQSAADSDGFGQRAAVLELRAGQPDVAWGPYEPAIRQWERVLGRAVPWPTDLRGRLSPVFTEWMMGLPDGWVTAVPGLTRNAMLKALGNGVVWQQAEAALHLLVARASSAASAA